jgi:hypothetical protein
MSLLDPGADSLKMDFFVTSLGFPMHIGSADSLNPAWRKSRLSTVIDFVQSLDNPQSSPPDSLTYTGTSIQIPPTLLFTSAIFYFRTEDGNYGRMLLQRNPATGVLIWGFYPYRYLTLQISYQTTPDIPYSERAQLREPGR